MIHLARTDNNDKNFITLVRHLDAELAERDGNEHAFYAQYDGITAIRHVVLAFDDAIAIGCGAIKEYEPGCIEVKRMYTIPSYRGKGVASLVLRELEQWGKEMNYHTCILETGKRQPEAIALYKKNNYAVIPNYAQYKGIENSVCFQKKLRG